MINNLAEETEAAANKNEMKSFTQSLESYLKIKNSAFNLWCLRQRQKTDYPRKNSIGLYEILLPVKFCCPRMPVV